jgi:hypothetical protein
MQTVGSQMQSAVKKAEQEFLRIYPVIVIYFHS